MQPSRRKCLYASLAWLALLPLAPRTSAESLTITSKPSGATIEIDGTAVGTTPYTVEYPGSYFHKPHTVFGQRLRHSITLRISKEGYTAQHITLTTGPYDWVSVTGRRHGTYFLLRSDHFDIQLELGPLFTHEPADSNGRVGPMNPRTVATAQPAQKASAPSIGSVAVASDPAGAEIYVDGKFAGQTPSTIPLAGGPHRVELRSPGRKNWERELEVIEGSQLTLHPILELQP
jgi:PEGA domain